MESSVVSLVFISILFNTNPTECQTEWWTAAGEAVRFTTTAPPLLPILLSANTGAPKAKTISARHTFPEVVDTIEMPRDKVSLKEKYPLLMPTKKPIDYVTKPDVFLKASPKSNGISRQ